MAGGEVSIAACDELGFCPLGGSEGDDRHCGGGGGGGRGGGGGGLIFSPIT